MEGAGECICYEVPGVEARQLENVFAMRSLVLKHDIATMYKMYSEKYKDAMPGKPPIGSTLLPKTSPEKVRSRRHVQEWTTSRSTSTPTTLMLWTRLLMCLLRSQMWTTSCVMSSTAFAPMCTPSSVMGMQCM